MIAYGRLIDTWAEISTLPDERCQIFYRCLNSRALHPSPAMARAADDLVRSEGLIVTIRNSRKNI